MVALHSLTGLSFSQTRSELVDGGSLKLRFFNLTPGQKYCAVAHFPSSNASNTECVHIPPLGKQCLIHFHFYFYSNFRNRLSPALVSGDIDNENLS